MYRSYFQYISNRGFRVSQRCSIRLLVIIFVVVESQESGLHLEVAERVAETLRQEPYFFLTNNCLIKSSRFRRVCRAYGIPARIVVCIGAADAVWFGRRFTIPVVHGWGEVEGKRIEVSRPLGYPAVWRIIPVNIRPLLVVRF